MKPTTEIQKKLESEIKTIKLKSNQVSTGITEKISNIKKLKKSSKNRLKLDKQLAIEDNMRKATTKFEQSKTIKTKTKYCNQVIEECWKILEEYKKNKIEMQSYKTKIEQLNSNCEDFRQAILVELSDIKKRAAIETQKSKKSIFIYPESNIGGTTYKGSDSVFSSKYVGSL